MKTFHNYSYCKLVFPEGRTSIHILAECICASLRYEKSKILNKGFTLALRCSYPTLLTKQNNSNYPVVSFEAAGFLYPKII